MKRIDPKIYNKEYYLKSCLGFEEFKATKGKKVHLRIVQFVALAGVQKGMHVLDLGCGRGDLTIECAKRGAKVVGIDYSMDGIALAKENLKNQPKAIQKNVTFLVMDAKKLDFKDNVFDLIISVDVFEHLYKEELEVAMSEIKRVLKPDGRLFVHTETNKIYLDFTHRIWSYPMDQLLIICNRLINKKNYPGLQKDPRNDLHKMQHVNEPTYYYLKNLFVRHRFRGKIMSLVPLKPRLSWKDILHNTLVSFYPFSQYFPLHIFFAHEYLCIMENKK